MSQGRKRKTSGHGVLRWKEKDFGTRCPKVEREILRDTVSQSGNDEIQYEPQEERMLHCSFLHQEIKMKKDDKVMFHTEL